MRAVLDAENGPDSHYYRNKILPRLACYPRTEFVVFPEGCDFVVP